MVLIKYLGAVIKDYLSGIVDLTGDRYLNPVPATYDNGTHIRNVGTIKSISIHHDAVDRPHDYDSIARYRSEAASHYTRLGPGLQYHYKIDNTGVIFAIRPLGTWLYAVGSDENTSNLAICLDGNFNNQVPTREQYEALSQLLVNLCEKHPEFPATYPDVRPHRDFSATACPGDNLAPWVYAIQDKATATAIPAEATYDWPEFQPQLTETPALPVNPATSHTDPMPEPMPDPMPEPERAVPAEPITEEPTVSTPTEPTAPIIVPVPVTVVDSPASVAPQPKIVAVGLSGALTVLVLFVVNSYIIQPLGLALPGEVSAALTLIVSTVTGYLTSNK